MRYDKFNKKRNGFPKFVTKNQISGEMWFNFFFDERGREVG